MVYQAIKALVQYGMEKGLLTEDDVIYARNQILEALKMDEYEEPEGASMILTIHEFHKAKMG